MTVYIVMEQHIHDDPEILGVFSTEELAEEFVEENEMDMGGPTMWIDEWIVDGRDSR